MYLRKLTNIIYDNLDFISFLFQEVSCDLTKKKKKL